MYPPIGFQKIFKKIDIFVVIDEVGESNIKGWKRNFIEGSDQRIFVQDYSEIRNIVYQNQHLFGRTDNDEFFALACWNRYGAEYIYTIYEDPSFPTLNFSDVKQAEKKAATGSFLIKWKVLISLEPSKKGFDLYINPSKIDFDPKLLESKRYNFNDNNLYEEIKNILRR